MITLPNPLIELIISGNKQFEMRKCLPVYMEIGTDGFYALEKGTDKVRCWCRVDHVVKAIMTKQLAINYAPSLGVSSEYILNYAQEGSLVYMWAIGKVIKLNEMRRDSFSLNKNPQSFVYCPLSDGGPL